MYTLVNKLNKETLLNGHNGDDAVAAASTAVVTNHSMHIPETNGHYTGNNNNISLYL